MSTLIQRHPDRRRAPRDRQRKRTGPSFTHSASFAKMMN